MRSTFQYGKISQGSKISNPEKLPNSIFKSVRNSCQILSTTTWQSQPGILYQFFSIFKSLPTKKRAMKKKIVFHGKRRTIEWFHEWGDIFTWSSRTKWYHGKKKQKDEDFSDCPRFSNTLKSSVLGNCDIFIVWHLREGVRKFMTVYTLLNTRCFLEHFLRVC